MLEVNGHWAAKAWMAKNDIEEAGGRECEESWVED